MSVQLVKIASCDPSEAECRESEEPVGYVGVHVNDLLVVGGPVFSRMIREDLSNKFPVGEWLIDDFDYLGSHIKGIPHQSQRQGCLRLSGSICQQPFG